jgi:hypothetical protein
MCPNRRLLNDCWIRFQNLHRSLQTFRRLDGCRFESLDIAIVAGASMRIAPSLLNTRAVGRRGIVAIRCSLSTALPGERQVGYTCDGIRIAMHRWPRQAGTGNIGIESERSEVGHSLQMLYELGSRWGEDADSQDHFTKVIPASACVSRNDFAARNSKCEGSNPIGSLDG